MNCLLEYIREKILSVFPTYQDNIYNVFILQELLDAYKARFGQCLGETLQPYTAHGDEYTWSPLYRMPGLMINTFEVKKGFLPYMFLSPLPRKSNLTITLPMLKDRIRRVLLFYYPRYMTSAKCERFYNSIYGQRFEESLNQLSNGPFYKSIRDGSWDECIEWKQKGWIENDILIRYKVPVDTSGVKQDVLSVVPDVDKCLLKLVHMNHASESKKLGVTEEGKEEKTVEEEIVYPAHDDGMSDTGDMESGGARYVENSEGDNSSLSLSSVSDGANDPEVLDETQTMMNEHFPFQTNDDVNEQDSRKRKYDEIPLEEDSEAGEENNDWDIFEVHQTKSFYGEEPSSTSTLHHNEEHRNSFDEHMKVYDESDIIGLSHILPAPSIHCSSQQLPKMPRKK